MKRKIAAVFIISIALLAGCGNQSLNDDLREAQDKITNLSSELDKSKQEAESYKVLLDELETRKTQESSTNETQQEISKHIDEFIVEEVKAEDLSNGYVDLVYKIKNNSSMDLTFQAISITEIDKEGDILNNYDSYNKHAMPTLLKPGQSLYLDLTQKYGEIKTIQSRGYVYTNNEEEYINGTFSKPLEFNVDDLLNGKNLILSEEKPERMPEKITEKISEKTEKPVEKITENKATEQEASKKSNVYSAFLNATTLDKKNLDVTASGRYKFKNIEIIEEESEWLEAGALYRSLAMKLEGFYVLSESFYGNWDNNACKVIFGFDKLESWDKMKPYIDDASIFITREKSKDAILTKLQGLETVEGNFDFENNKFDFTITDLTATASSLHISEEMLGYTLASLEEYAPTSEFKENTYKFTL